MATIEIIRTDLDGNAFTASEFLNYIRRSNKVWWDDDDNGRSCPWVFRGQRNAEWELVPSAFRSLEQNLLKPLIENISESPAFQHKYFKDQTSGFRSAAVTFSAFYLAVGHFYDLCLELGLIDELANFDDPFGMAGFRLNPDGMDHYYELCSRQIIGLAQHHGIPTPFLDWTKKPEVAGHFSAQMVSPKDQTDIALYALRVGNFRSAKHPRLPQNILSAYMPDKDQKMLRLPFDIIVDAPARNSYLAAQHGLFTLFDDLTEYFKSGVCLSLDRVIENRMRNTGVVLKKIILPKQEVQEFRKLLDKEGLTEAHLMPTAEKVAQTVVSRWSFE